MIENETNFYENWFESYVVVVNYDLKEGNSIMTFNEFNRKYEFEVSSPIYNKYRAAIKKWVKQVNAEKVYMSHEEYIESLWEATFILAVQCNPSLQMNFTM